MSVLWGREQVGSTAFLARNLAMPPVVRITSCRSSGTGKAGSTQESVITVGQVEAHCGRASDRARFLSGLRR